MKWFDRWFAKKVQQAWSDAAQPADDAKLEASLRIRSGRLAKQAYSVPERRFEKRGMTFTVYNANGGYAVEYLFYDEKNDENINRLHIIPADKDLGQSIGLIIDYEMMMK